MYLLNHLKQVVWETDISLESWGAPLIGKAFVAPMMSRVPKGY